MLNRALNLLFPPRCIQCGVATDEQSGVCPACWGELHFLSAPQCSTCSHPFSYAIEEGAQCAQCMADPPPYDRALSVLAYTPAARPLLTRYKYGDKTQMTDTLATWMYQCATPIWPQVDVICPVPLHPIRLLQRRYNQSALLAAAVGNMAQLPVRQQLLTRTKHTKPQASLSRSVRLGNVKGCFTVPVPERVKGKGVLLIDDVITTGATVKECSRVLKKAGAKHVFVLTVAKAIDDAAL